MTPYGPVSPCLATLKFWFQGTLRYQFTKVKIVGLKVCWFVVSLDGGGNLQNFRPLGSFFLVESLVGLVV